MNRTYGYLADSCDFRKPTVCLVPKKIYIYENAHVYENATFIISPDGANGRFIMKRNSGAAQGLTVITNTHKLEPQIGKFHMDCMKEKIDDKEKDVIVEEDVWIGANVTLLPGVKIGRGAVVGAGSVVRKNIPPYAVVMGNPARVISFTLTPDEILEHEKILYDEGERLEKRILEKNYDKYFVKCFEEIVDYLK